MATTGLVLAAGAGSRAGGPKALKREWVEHACESLLAGGCSSVIVVLGAAPDAAIPTDPRISSVVATDWAQGMSRSLVAGLEAARRSVEAAPASADKHAVLVSLVDLPGLPSAVVARVRAGRGPLRQAVFGGRPGHPVYIEAGHWAAVAESLHGDAGARNYLVAHGVTEIECGDVWDGQDIDGPRAKPQ